MYTYMYMYRKEEVRERTLTLRKQHIEAQRPEGRRARWRKRTRHEVGSESVFFFFF